MTHYTKYATECNDYNCKKLLFCVLSFSLNANLILTSDVREKKIWVSINAVLIKDVFFSFILPRTNVTFKQTKIPKLYQYQYIHLVHKCR